LLQTAITFITLVVVLTAFSVSCGNVLALIVIYAPILSVLLRLFSNKIFHMCM